MKVVMVAPFARRPKATTSARVLPLARALAERGHSVTVLVPPYDNPAESGAQLTHGGAKVVSLRVNRRLPEQSVLQGVQQPRLALSIVRRVRALAPDVVHVFKPKAVSGLAQTLLWYLPVGRAALVLDTDDWEGTGGWNDYERYPWWQKLICDWQEGWGLRHAGAFTAASRALEDRIHRLGAQPDRVQYVPNGLDARDYPGWQDGDGARGRERLGISPGPLLLLYTRFFEFTPERVWETLRRVRAARPDVRLLVVGAGKFGQERRLPELAERAGQPDSVIVAGWQEPEALPDLLLAGDVALFPADDNLANRAKCSTKVLELLWLRRPAVADRVGQYGEYVEDGATGLLSEPNDPDSMARSALRLLDDGALASRLAATGRERVQARYGWDRLVDGVERAYRAASVSVT
ncbi:MAG TPA: glycosyltransferase family 4 protein [Chloroflexota bacterium]|nr:glycosyltransferase family 4 protein [Chloroflexota bacterium]